MFIHGKKAAVLAIALMVSSTVILLASIYMLRALHEKAMAERELRSVKANYIAQAGAHSGLDMLDTIVNSYLLNTVNATSATTIASQAASYVSSNNSLGFLIAYALNNGTAVLTLNGSEAVYSGTSTALDGGTFIYTIRIRAKGNPNAVTSNIWDFPYYYAIQTTSTQGSQSQKLSLNGDFTVRVQKDNFARYALCTDSQAMSSGTSVWFNSNTFFSGPMFTNGRFNFAGNPAGVFYNTVKQVSSTAQFFNGGSTVLLNNDHNGTADVPTFYDSFSRNQTSISMPTTSVETDMANEASAGNTYASNGVYVPVSGSAVSGGVYVKGDASITMSVDGSDRAVYTIVQGAQTRTITIDRTNNQTLYNTGSSTTTYTGVPDGVSNVGTIIYVNGNITSFSGTVQKDTQVTVAASDDVVIQNNVRYANYTAGSGTPGAAGYIAPSASGTTNLLGILSWNGDVRVGSSAPNNVDIHATIMAKSGVLQVDNYGSGSPRGTATVLGGVISDNYGAFGTFGGSSGSLLSGYGRNFVYDDRMETQYTPPYFPTMNTFIAFTNDINDKKFWQNGGF